MFYSALEKVRKPDSNRLYFIIFVEI